MKIDTESGSQDPLTRALEKLDRLRRRGLPGELVVRVDEYQITECQVTERFRPNPPPRLRPGETSLQAPTPQVAPAPTEPGSQQGAQAQACTACGSDLQRCGLCGAFNSTGAG